MNNMASALQWIPDTLYNYSLAAVAANFSSFLKDIRVLPDSMLFDVYYQLYKEGHLKRLSIEFSSLDIFRRLINVKDKRYLLHNCFQAVMDHGCPVADELAQAFSCLCLRSSKLSPAAKFDVVLLGFSIGNFLVDSGWFLASEIIFKSCLLLCGSIQPCCSMSLEVQCYSRLIHVQAVYCKFSEARKTLNEAKKFIEEVQALGLGVNLASLYAAFSSYYFSVCDNKEAYRWAVAALKELDSYLLPKEIVQVLCSASKGCILKRDYKKADLLLKQALSLAKENYGSHSLVYASVLLNYGYYLSSIDFVQDALRVYQNALTLHTRVFAGNNLLVAKCHEDLAYTSYIVEYTTGHFKDSMDHADKALSIMKNLSIEDGFLLISAKKAKALILEEIAIDSNDFLARKKYFAEAKDLHMYGLHYVTKAFGEWNLHAAKYYGNIGRLYQSMKKYKKAQTMMLKAIAIREALLEQDDYEIAISLSQLASLYTYDMELHKEAEVLFLKSVEIGRKVFGEGYSGLEYNYKGLLKVYTSLGETAKAMQYRMIFNHWKDLRDTAEEMQSIYSPSDFKMESLPLEEILKQFVTIQ